MALRDEKLANDSNGNLEGVCWWERKSAKKTGVRQEGSVRLQEKHLYLKQDERKLLGTVGKNGWG